MSQQVGKAHRTWSGSSRASTRTSTPTPSPLLGERAPPAHDVGVRARSTTGNDQKYVARLHANQDIIAGNFDAYLTKYADALMANGPAAGHPSRPRDERHLVQLGREGATRSTERAGSYVAMWQHVHDVFADAGANDYVIWIWAPNRINKLGNAKHQTLATT